MTKGHEIDYRVSHARCLAEELNTELDALRGLGVECPSVVGPFDPMDTGRFAPRPINRVNLTLHFKAGE